MISISVVIPTRNRILSLQRLLESIRGQILKPKEIIVVDASDDQTHLIDLEAAYSEVKFLRYSQRPSVCVQRNEGIKKSIYDWIFLCDDDLELEPRYLLEVAQHINTHSSAGAVSGRILQWSAHDNNWVDQYPVVSMPSLLFSYVFRTGLWGEIVATNFISKAIKAKLLQKGNHISVAGWPVIVDFAVPYFKTPAFGLGASIVRKDWLLQSPFDEVLDAHGIGDNYGVALGFPTEGIHVISTTYVYHHQSIENRLPSEMIFYRRSLAVDYFFKSKVLAFPVARRWLLWSLFGKALGFLFNSKFKMLYASLKAGVVIMTGRNPYVLGKLKGSKTVTPV